MSQGKALTDERAIFLKAKEEHELKLKGMGKEKINEEDGTLKKFK